MKKKLFYFTDSYPYGTGEKTFVEKEIKLFSDHYDVSVVSLAADREVKDVDHVSKLPNNVKLIYCGKRKLPLKFFYTLMFLFSNAGRAEIKRIFKSKKDIFARTMLSAFKYASGKTVLFQLRKAGVFNEASNSIYYTFWFSTALLSCAIEKNETRKQFTLISRIHGYDLYEERCQRSWQSLQVFKANYVDRIIFLTNHALRYFCSKYIDVSWKSEICALGSRRAYMIPEMDKKRDVYRIVSCSHLIPLKRVDLIVAALCLIKDLDIEWFHFGGGNELGRVSKMARDKGIKACFFGQVESKEIYDFYSKYYIDIFLTTSASEGLPVSIQEAMAFKIPIIGTDVGGISEEIDGNGILLSANPSPEEVAQAIKEILLLPNDQTAIFRNRSYELWEQKFNQNENCLRILQLIEKADYSCGGC